MNLDLLDGDYTISGAHRTARGRVVVDVVAYPGLQRMSVMMPRAFSTAEEIGATIRQALAGLQAKPKPVHTSS